MQKFLIFLLCFSPLAADSSSDEELLFARRIVECWRDQEIDLTKSQIGSFLESYPTSHFVDHFNAILGDISLKEGAFINAIASYENIKSGDLLRQVRTKRWYALYQLKAYGQLYQEISPLISFIEEEEARFYFAEAAFREALTLTDDQKNALFEECLPIYRTLEEHPQFGEHALLAMGEIYRQLDQFDQSAAIYLRLAEEKKSHQTLFHAATMLTRCNEEKAIELFSQIAKGGGKKSSEAAYQWLQLLAKHAQWETILRERRSFLSSLAQHHLPVYYFYLGVLYHKQNEWDLAIESLTKSLKGGLKPPHDRNALLNLMVAAKEAPSLKAADFGYLLLKDRYPNDFEEASLFRAIAYRKRGEDRIATSLFSELIAIAEKSNVLEESYLEKTHLLMKNKEWESANDLVLHYLSHFPAATHRNEMIRLSIDLALTALSFDENYERLATNLERALGTKGLLNEEESFKERLLLAKCYLKLENPTLASPLLKELIEQTSDSAELHYLMVVTLLKNEGEPNLIVAHGEKALALEPNFSEADRLHLYLFNAYLDLSKKDCDKSLTEAAATHLYQVVHTIPISLENQLWLIHTYAKESTYSNRAVQLLENILSERESFSRFPEEALLLAKLYDEEGRYEQALHLLQTLKKESLSTPHIDLMLGSILGHTKQFEQAQHLLLPLEKATDPTISLKATLENARINLLKEAGCANSLHKLKELWIQKSIAHEPIHLEAALDYADASPPEKLLEILHEIKEHFVSQTDICSKDYHEARLKSPEKDHLYQSYMRYLNARIALAETEVEKRNGIDVKEKIRSSNTLLKSLTEGDYATTKYLRAKALNRIN
ncbi:MAG: Lipopolysaccharide assembly protein B [Chlamydiales bacterium]|nr:Lipopolysaccharide assembly protein B [Chlamydiales bacterium]MCH9619735.1 Lipopolysaccharide assembly protein B [Chlamydiales bacterium]MCH9623341.1 Lipopolysaccharide assembly protein B [Chlamydiales bacterium]